MQKPTFRNPDLFQVLPFREWLRKNKPSGNRGYVVEDLDLLLRVYGERYHTNGQGRFILCELKFKTAWIGNAQRRTFGLLDRLLRKADSKGEQYQGYYVIQYDNEDWDISTFRVNRQQLTREQFNLFLDLDTEILRWLSKYNPLT